MDIGLALQRLSISFIPVLLGIILHEVAHGYAASKFGDDTARLQGRLTLNPIPHIDPMGFMMFVVTALLAPFTFGWAKPVPVNVRNFRAKGNLKREMMLVALAGPFANLLLALFCALVLKLLLLFTGEFLLTTTGTFIFRVLETGIVANFILMLINLLPIPPLDGSHVMVNFLPNPWDYKYMSFGQYGFLILIGLIFFGVVGYIISFFLDLLLPLVAQFLLW